SRLPWGRAASRACSCCELQESAQRDGEPAGAIGRLVTQFVQRLLYEEELQQRAQRLPVRGNGIEARRRLGVAFEEVVACAALPLRELLERGRVERATRVP